MIVCQRLFGQNTVNSNAVNFRPAAAKPRPASRHGRAGRWGSAAGFGRRARGGDLVRMAGKNMGRNGFRGSAAFCGAHMLTLARRDGGAPSANGPEPAGARPDAAKAGRPGVAARGGPGARACRSENVLKITFLGFDGLFGSRIRASFPSGGIYKSEMFGEIGKIDLAQNYH